MTITIDVIPVLLFIASLFVVVFVLARAGSKADIREVQTGVFLLVVILMSIGLYHSVRIIWTTISGGYGG